jgi:hypothetical protein
METTGTGIRKEQITIPCCIPGMSVKRWFCIFVLLLLFMALCVAVFAQEPGQYSGSCDLQNGLPSTLNLSRQQCEKMRKLTNSFYSDTAVTRGKIMEKRLELRRLSRDPKTDPHAINQTEQALNSLEQKLSLRAHRTEANQRRLLNSEQINKMKEMSYVYGYQGYGRRGYWKTLQR